MNSPAKHIGLVISPLEALVTSQVTNLLEHGVEAIVLKKKMSKKQREGKYTCIPYKPKIHESDVILNLLHFQFQLYVRVSTLWYSLQ